MAQQIRVFVSHHHSSEEEVFTARLVADLEAAGADVWVDDQRISSNNFVQKISEGLEGRQWLVLVMTPHSVASPWVRNEVNTALSEHTAGRMLGVIPLVMTSTPEQDIPVLWRPLHRHDATRAYEPARDGLLRALGLNKPVAFSAPTTSQPSESADGLLERGMTLMVQKHYSEALPLFEHAVVLAPTDPDARYLLGQALFFLGQYEQSLTAIEQAIALKPVFEATLGYEYHIKDMWLIKGDILCQFKQFDEAAEAYEQAIELDPRPMDSWAWYSLSEAFEQLHRYDEALGALEHYLARNSDNDAGWRDKARLLIRLGRYEEALNAYMSEWNILVDEPTPNDRAMMKNFDATVSLLKRLKRYDEALQVNDQVLGHSESKARWRRKAEILRALGRTAEAEAAERRAKELGG